MQGLGGTTLGRVHHVPLPKFPTKTVISCLYQLKKHPATAKSVILLLLSFDNVNLSYSLVFHRVSFKTFYSIYGISPFTWIDFPAPIEEEQNMIIWSLYVVQIVLKISEPCIGFVINIKYPHKIKHNLYDEIGVFMGN